LQWVIKQLRKIGQKENKETIIYLLIIYNMKPENTIIDAVICQSCGMPNPLLVGNDNLLTEIYIPVRKIESLCILLWIPKYNRGYSSKSD